MHASNGSPAQEGLANLMITFQKPDTGEMVIQQVPMLPPEDLAFASSQERIMADVETDIQIDPTIPNGELFIDDCFSLIIND